MRGTSGSISSTSGGAGGGGGGSKSTDRPSSPSSPAPPVSAWGKSPKDVNKPANAWESTNATREKLISPIVGSASGGGGSGAVSPARALSPVMTTTVDVDAHNDEGMAMAPRDARGQVFFSLDPPPGVIGSPPSSRGSGEIGTPPTSKGAAGGRRTEICTILEMADLPLLYDDVFRNYGVDSKADILALSDEDWTSLEFKPFHRKKLQDFLRASGSSTQ